MHDIGNAINRSHHAEYGGLLANEILKKTDMSVRDRVPTVVDRVIQQAIAQEISPIFEEQFSENSFGVRPKRGAHN